MLAGVAIGVRNDAAPATATSMSTGASATPDSLRHGHRDGRDDEHGRGVADHLTEQHGEHEDRGEDHLRAAVADDADQPAGHQVRRPGRGDRDRQRDEPADEHDGLPGDRPVGLRAADDAGHHHRGRADQPRDRGRDHARGQQRDRADQHRDRAPRLRAERHGLPADQLGAVDDEHVVVGRERLDRGPRPVHQERVALGQRQVVAAAVLAQPPDAEHRDAGPDQAREHDLADHPRAGPDDQLRDARPPGRAAPRGSPGSAASSRRRTRAGRPAT